MLASSLIMNPDRKVLHHWTIFLFTHASDVKLIDKGVKFPKGRTQRRSRCTALLGVLSLTCWREHCFTICSTVSPCVDGHGPVASLCDGKCCSVSLFIGDKKCNGGGEGGHEGMTILGRG